MSEAVLFSDSASCVIVLGYKFVSARMRHEARQRLKMFLEKVETVVMLRKFMKLPRNNDSSRHHVSVSPP